MTQTQRCQYCGDYYRMDEDASPIETDDGWMIDICRQCHNEFNSEQLALSEAWQLYYQQLDEEGHL